MNEHKWLSRANSCNVNSSTIGHFYKLMGQIFRLYKIWDTLAFDRRHDDANYQPQRVMTVASQFDWFSMRSIPVGVSPTVLRAAQAQPARGYEHGSHHDRVA